MGTHYNLWVGIDDLKWKWFFSWVKVKATAMKIDSSLVVISVSVGAGKPFHFFNFAVDDFPHGICYAVFSIGYNIIDI